MHRSALTWLVLTAALVAGCRRGEQPPATTGAAAVESTAVAPGSADSTLPADVMGVTWEWVSFTTPVEQITVAEPARYTIRFEPDGRIALQADCNRGAAPYTITGERRFTIGPMALTRAMCPPGSLSDRFAREVGRATSLFQRDGGLFLELPMDSGTLRFRRQP